jgi:GntR family transcriptional regulator/MocR family aminotransferase
MWFWLGFEPLCCQYDFSKSGAIIKTIPIDEQGLDVDYIKTRFVKDNCCVYICAIVIPTTVSLTAERRLKLLQLAKEYQFAIIEDDYDYDFQFEGLAMLYGQLRCKWNGNLWKSLTQSLFPSFQTGFVVAQKI